MSAVCLSLVPILRCIALSRLETGLLLIPPALEVVFSLGLVFAGWGAGRRRFLLAAEGPIYFLLCLLDLLSHLIPALADSLAAFRALDILIAAASFLPILLYTSFLYSFKRAEFFPSFPRRFRTFAILFSLVIIPFIIATNEIGSFIGNTYRLVSFPGSSKAQPAIGSNDPTIQFVRVFFNSLSLALMTVYQVATFAVAFIRLARAFLGQRTIEASSGTSQVSYLFRGTGWIAVGVKLGAIESVIGFAQGNFGIFFLRRLLRMLGRACLIIGVVRGPDTLENFQMLDAELRGGREKHRSTRFITISGPVAAGDTRQRNSRTSTNPSSFQPIATFSTFGLKQPFNPMTPSSLGARFPLDNAPPLPTIIPNASAAFARPRPHPLTLMPQGQRVTVFQRHNRAPTLILRLSDTDLPSPSTIMGHTALELEREDPKSPPMSVGSSMDTKVSPIAKSVASAPLPLLARRISAARGSGYGPVFPAPSVTRNWSTSTADAARSRAQPSAQELPRYMRSNAYAGRARVMSASSLASDSLDVVQDLSSRFSSIPPRVTSRVPPRYDGAGYGYGYGYDNAYGSVPEERADTARGLERDNSGKSTGSVSRGTGSAKRKPPPVIRASMLPPLDVPPPRAGIEATAYPISPPDTLFGSEFAPYRGPAEFDRDPRASAALTLPESIHSGQWMSPGGSAGPASPPDVEAYRRGPPTAPTPITASDRALASAGATEMEIPWLINTELADETETAWRNSLSVPYSAVAPSSIASPPGEYARGESVLGALAPPRTRIKSIGRAPRRRTPTPTSVSFSRDSVAPTVEELPVDAVERASRRASAATARSGRSGKSSRSGRSVLVKSRAGSDAARAPAGATLTRQDSGVLGKEDQEYVRRSFIEADGR